MISYEIWKNLVDKQIVKVIGMDCDDLPDHYDFEAAYEDQLSPEDAVKEMLKEEDMDILDDDEDYDQEMQDACGMNHDNYNEDEPLY